MDGVQVIHEAENSRFVARENGEEMGYLQYGAPADKIYSADSTVVDGRFRGRGVAEKLLDALVAHAEETGGKVRPVCSYVARRFEKEPEKYAVVRE